jgi:hypothetical protein
MNFKNFKLKFLNFSTTMNKKILVSLTICLLIAGIIHAINKEGKKLKFQLLMILDLKLKSYLY